MSSTFGAFTSTLTPREVWEKSLLLQGTQAAWAIRAVDKVETLADVEFKVFSQFGDDGIVEWLVSRLPGIPSTFIEFGVEDYEEANTRFLLCHRNWRGLIIDSSPRNMARLRHQQIYWKHDLRAITAFVRRDNINDLIAANGFKGDVGLLVIDIDGNDYWVWKAMATEPWIVVVEYNAVFGDVHPLSVPYDAAFRRTEAHPSNLYFGASIKAFETLGKERQYSLLGTNRAGNNAYFLRNDLLPHVQGRIADRRPRPSLFREARSSDRRLSYVAGTLRRDLIADTVVTNVEEGTQSRLGDIHGLYSAEWSGIMG